MFIKIRAGKYINLDQVIWMQESGFRKPSDDNGVVMDFVFANGHEMTGEVHFEVVGRIKQSNIIPALPGYSRLELMLTADSHHIAAHPIVGWTGTDIYLDPVCVEPSSLSTLDAVQYPDGRVVYEGEIYDDIEQWLAERRHEFDERQAQRAA